MDRTLSAERLVPKERVALERARQTPLSYGVRMYACAGSSSSSRDRRLLVVLGEAHLKLEPAAELGKEIVACFALRGVETFQCRQVLGGRVLGFLIRAPRLLLRAATFGLVKGSTITDALALPTGITVELERTKAVPFALHVASVYLIVLFVVLWGTFGFAIARSVSPALDTGVLEAAGRWLTAAALALELQFLLLVPAILVRRRWWSWLVHPVIGVLTARDVLMAEGTVRMLEAHPEAATAIVVMGRAHLPGFEYELLEQHGFERVDF